MMMTTMEQPEFAPVSAGRIECFARRVAWSAVDRLTMLSDDDCAEWWAQALINFAMANEGDPDAPAPIMLLDEDLALTTGRLERFGQRVAWTLVDVLAWLPQTKRVNWWTGALIAFAWTGEEA
jgi:hypothetical protein